jgi:site-specific recombinase XerD
MGLASGYVAELDRLAFTGKSATNQLRLFADLLRWLDRRGLSLSGLTAVGVDAFLAERRARGIALYSRRATECLLAWLAVTGLISTDAAVRVPPVDIEAVVLFEEYLRHERRLSEVTITNLVPRVRRFVASYVPRGGLTGLTPQLVSQAMLDEGACRKPSSVKKLGYVLRSFLRFCWVAGQVDRDLSGALTVAMARQPCRLPVGVGADTVKRLLDGCDQTTRVGLRDLAVLTLLARLGLRSQEIAGLRLDDIDWYRGEITVTGKSGKIERLPLPGQAGEAIAAYLTRARPSSQARTVFLRHRAPIQPMTRAGVKMIVHQACGRAGLEPFGPHRLRHTLAETMVATGVGFEAIGQVLRHDSPLTTANYARVDVDQLRLLARPWPDAGARP